MVMETALPVVPQHPVFEAGAQVDAVAACSLPSGALHSDDDDAEELEPELPLLAVALSQLEGNLWGGGVALLDGATGEKLCALQLETGVGALAWCGGDGDVLALACDDGDVRLARLSTDVAFAFLPLACASVVESSVRGSLTATMMEDATAASSAASVGWGHDDVVTGVSASALDKTRLATSSWDLTVKLWDIATMDKAIATLDGHTDLVWAVATSPLHAHLLCSASQDATVQVWDARRPQQAALSVATQQCAALAVDWHPQQSTVFSVGLEDGVVCTFDVRSPHTPLARRETHSAAVHAVKYSPFHEDLLATGGDDGKAFVTTDSFTSSRVDTAARELLTAGSRPHRDYVRALDWFQRPATATTLSSADDASMETLLATGAWDKSVHTWNVDDYASASTSNESTRAMVGNVSAAPAAVSVA